MEEEIQDIYITREAREALVKSLSKMRIIGRPHKCYGWKGAPSKRGGPRITHDGKAMLANRAAWIAEHGKIPEFMYVLHKCGDKMCTNPRHMFISKLKGPRMKPGERKSGRPSRERLGVDLPSKLVFGIKRYARKRNITITKYMYMLLSRALEVERHYEANED